MVKPGMNSFLIKFMFSKKKDFGINFDHTYFLTFLRRIALTAVDVIPNFFARDG